MEHSNFSRDLIVDSLDLVEVIWEIERNFKVSIPDEEVEKLQTVGQLINYVDERS